MDLSTGDAPGKLTRHEKKLAQMRANGQLLFPFMETMETTEAKFTKAPLSRHGCGLSRQQSEGKQAMKKAAWV